MLNINPKTASTNILDVVGVPTGLRSSAILSLDLKLAHRCENQKESGIFLASTRIYMNAKKKILALPRWIAGNHTFYFGKTCLFQDGRGDDKK